MLSDSEVTQILKHQKADTDVVEIKNDVLETDVEGENFVSCDEEGSIKAVEASAEENAYLESMRSYEASEEAYLEGKRHY